MPQVLKALSQRASALPSETWTGPTLLVTGAQTCSPHVGRFAGRCAEPSADIPSIREQACTTVLAAFLADWALQPAAWLAHRPAGRLAAWLGHDTQTCPCACVRYSPQTPYPAYGGAPAGRSRCFCAFCRKFTPWTSLSSAHHARARESGRFTFGVVHIPDFFCCMNQGFEIPNRPGVRMSQRT